VRCIWIQNSAITGNQAENRPAVDWSALFYLVLPRILDGPPFSATIDTRLPFPRLPSFCVDLHNDCTSCNDLIAIVLFLAGDQEKREKHAEGFHVSV
jgi:hypothetical protein